MERYKYRGNRGAQCDVAIYRNVNEWIEYLKTQEGYDTYGNSKWAGSDSQTAFAEVLNGVPEHETKAARDLINQIDAKFADRHKYKRVYSYVGARVHVGKMLTGSPKCAVRRKRMSDDFAPIKLVMEIQVSAGVHDAELRRRGAALAALATVMAKERPVELWMAFAIGNSHGSPNYASHTACGMVRVPTTPISLSQCIAMFATNATCRRLSFTDGRSRLGTGWSGGWGFGNNPDNEDRNRQFREALRLKPVDVFIPGGHLHHSSQMMRDPVAWVNERIEKQRGNA